MNEAWPEEQFCVSFSGGRTSGMMLIGLIQEYGPIPDNGRVLFQNTSREADETYEFIQRVSDFCDQEVIWLEFFQEKKYKPGFRVVDINTAKRDGSVFKNAMAYQGDWLPNMHRRWCTKNMKRLTMYRYMKSIGAKKFSNFVGIRADEGHRIKQVGDGIVTRLFPLADWNLDRGDVVEFWSKMPFDLELPYDKGKTIFGNCTGCFLKSEREIALLAKMRPEEFAWWEDLEHNSGSDFVLGRTYKQIREKVEKGEIVFSLEDYFCQKEDGECTE